MFASSLGIEPDSLLNGRYRYRRLDRLPTEAGIVPRSCVLCSQLRIRQRVFFRMLGERIKLQAEKRIRTHRLVRAVRLPRAGGIVPSSSLSTRCLRTSEYAVKVKGQTAEFAGATHMTATLPPPLQAMLPDEFAPCFAGM